MSADARLLLRHRFHVLLHSIRFPGQPIFSTAAAEGSIGRRIIVGITYQDHLHRLVRQDQYHGRISRANPREGIVIQTPSGAERALLPDLRALFGTRPGEYRFRSTGEVVVGADLTTAWTEVSPLPCTTDSPS